MSWDISNNAGLRPALFFELIDLDFKKIYKICDEISKKDLLADNFDIFKCFKIYLFEMIDTLFAPYIIEEIYLQKGRLVGTNSYEKYKSFFLTEDLTWHPGALLIEKKYSEKLALIKNIFKGELDSFEHFLNRYIKNVHNIKQQFSLKTTKIKKMKFNLSDKHNFNGSAILLTFENNQKLIYKPKNVMNDVLFNKIVNCLNVNSQIKIKIPLILYENEEYYWQEFIVHRTYKEKHDLNKFYIHVGLMLAICDTLNYTDGHSENFICTRGKQFVLIDTETILTNLSYFEDKTSNFYDLEFTGMLQKRDGKESYISAIQKQCGNVFFPFLPYIINDNTDKISFCYRQIKCNEQEQSYPSKTKINLKEYIASIEEGMILGYKQIQKHSKEIKSIVMSCCISLYPRQLKRHTLYYTWIICRFFHPHNNLFYRFMRNSLSNLSAEIVNYECSFLKYSNIPVFYHNPFQKSLMGFNREVIIQDYFDRNAIDWFLQKIDDLDNLKFREQRIKSMKTILSNKKAPF